MTLDACDRIRKPPAQGKPPAQVLGDDLRASIDITVLPCASTGFSHATVTCVTAHSSPFWKPDEVQGGTGYRLTPVAEVAGRIEG
jgi:hypothetical protein